MQNLGKIPFLHSTQSARETQWCLNQELRRTQRRGAYCMGGTPCVPRRQSRAGLPPSPKAKKHARVVQLPLSPVLLGGWESTEQTKLREAAKAHTCPPVQRCSWMRMVLGSPNLCHCPVWLLVSVIHESSDCLTRVFRKSTDKTHFLCLKALKLHTGYSQCVLFN